MATFTIDPSLIESAQTPLLTAKEAAQFMASTVANLPGVGPDIAAGLARIFDKLVAQLPAEALHHDVLAKLDVGQLLAYAAKDKAFSTDQHKQATWLLGEVDKGQETAVSQMAAAQQITDPAQVAQAVTNYHHHRDQSGTTLIESPTAQLGRLGITPTTTAPATTPPATTTGTLPSATPGVSPTAAPAATASPTVAPSSAGDYGLGASIAALGTNSTAPTLTRKDIVDMMNIGGSDSSIIAQTIQYQNEGKLAPDAVTVDTGLPRAGHGWTPGYLDSSWKPGFLGGSGSKPYTLTEINGLLSTMTRDQVTNMQQRLRLSGYYLTTSGGRQNGPDYQGDPTDQPTQAAWQRLITDSVRSGTSMVATLAAKHSEAVANKMIAPDGTPLDAGGYKLNKAGKRVDANGALLDVAGNPVDAYGNRIDAHGTKLDKAGNPVDAYGNRINAQNQRIDEAGYTVDAYGHRIDAHGQNVDAAGNLLDKLGHRVNKGGQRVDEAGNVVDANGNAIPDIQLTDAASIDTHAETIAQQTLGRKPTADEKKLLVASIHALEASRQSALNAPGSQTGQNVDVNAQIQEYLRANNPLEAGGHDVANTFGDFTKLLAGPGGGK